MNPKLQKLLEKRQIQGLEDLKGSEKQDFDRWERVLSEGEITVEKIKLFCESQIRVIEANWKQFTHTDQQVIAHTIYKAILECITSPVAEKEQLERYLQQIIDT
jgi:hypothetical protein